MITFTATPYAIGSWTVLRLPDEASARLPSRSQVMVTGTVNGVPFRAPLEPDGRKSHWLNFDKQLQDATGAQAGDTVTVELESTKDWPDPEVPADLQAAIDANPPVQAMWKRITPMARWEWLRWVNSTKEPATRQRRIEVSCSKMTAGERRPCCFNRNMCCIPDVSKNGVLIFPESTPR